MHIEQTLKALANKRRLALLKILSQKTEQNVSELSASINLSYRSTSRHLRVLEHAGLIASRQESTMIFYHMEKSMAHFLKPILKKV